MTDGEYKKQNLTNDLHTLYCTSKGVLFRFYLNMSFGWKAIQCMKMDNGRFIKCWVSRYFEYLSNRMHMYYPCGVFPVFYKLYACHFGPSMIYPGVNLCHREHLNTRVAKFVLFLYALKCMILHQNTVLCFPE